MAAPRAPAVSPLGIMYIGIFSCSSHFAGHSRAYLADEPILKFFARLYRSAANDQRVRIEGAYHFVEEKPKRMSLDAKDLTCRAGRFFSARPRTVLPPGASGRSYRVRGPDSAPETWEAAASRLRSASKATRGLPIRPQLHFGSIPIGSGDALITESARGPTLRQTHFSLSPHFRSRSRHRPSRCR